MDCKTAGPDLEARVCADLRLQSYTGRKCNRPFTRERAPERFAARSADATTEPAVFAFENLEAKSILKYPAMSGNAKNSEERALAKGKRIRGVEVGCVPDLRMNALMFDLVANCKAHLQDWTPQLTTVHEHDAALRCTHQVLRLYAVLDTETCMIKNFSLHAAHLTHKSSP